MRAIVSLHSLNATRGLVEIRKRKQPAPCGNELGKARVLRHRRSARREVTHRPTTEPTRARRGINILRHAEFTARFPDVSPIILRRRRDLRRLDHRPTQLAPLLSRHRSAAGGHLEFRPRARRHSRDLVELHLLRAVTHAAILDGFLEVFPSHHRGPFLSRRTRFPAVEHHRRTRRLPRQAQRW